jgi:uncharacterized protein YaaR (DUF327 family)
MLKIGDAQPLPDLPDPRRRRVGAKEGATGAGKSEGPAGVEASTFSRAFLDASKGAVTRALDQILDELNRQGERLLSSQNFRELERYKELVQEFLRTVTQGLGRLHFSDGGAQGRRAKVHVILQKVDEALEALAKDVLARQATQLKILERLDQIRGLLLDLYK